MVSSPIYRVLVIDDNPSIHDDIRKVLQRESKNITATRLAKAELFGSTEPQEHISLPNFEVNSAYQGQEGFEEVKKALQENRPYALAFVDIRMPPGWDGIETISQIWNVDKEIQVVICTAHSDYSWAEMIKHLGATDRLLILKKPFDNTEIRQLAFNLSRKWGLAQQVKEQMRLLESQINLRTAQIQATLESTTDGILSVGVGNKILNYNKKFVSLWNIPKDIVEKNDSNVILEFIADTLHNKENFKNKIQEVQDYPNTTFFDVLQCMDGKIIECYSQPQIFGEKYQGRVWCFRNVTKSKNLEDELAHRATHDSLTNLPNRALLYDRIQRAIASSKRSGTLFALLFFDLDRFKLINDTLGHIAGDAFLKIVTERLKPYIREIDTFARLGGDEFVILITQLKKEQDVISIVKNCLESLRKPFPFEGKEFYISASVGISIYPKDGEDIQTLLKNADMAMYRAKEQKTGNFHFYTNDLNRVAEERLILENNLQTALANNEFELYYQPQIDLKTRQIIGVEALLRWNHPKLGVVPPLEFIPLAEEIGLIVPIGEWVLRAACEQYKRWFKNNLPISLAINLTAQQLKQRNIVDTISNILEETNFDPHHLEIEFTESSLMSDVESITNKIIALKSLGVSLAIDDFGTGYSSLSYLNMFPLDKIKIDKSFVHYISADPEDTSIIQAIIAMAKSLNVIVLAEGVETEEQFNFLRDNACEQAQGYFFSRPLCSNECSKLLKKKYL